MAHHDSSNVFWVISIQVELEGHHLVIVCLQLALHHPVHFIRELMETERINADDMSKSRSYNMFVHMYETLL